MWPATLPSSSVTGMGTPCGVPMAHYVDANPLGCQLRGDGERVFLVVFSVGDQHDALYPW